MCVYMYVYAYIYKAGRYPLHARGGVPFQCAATVADSTYVDQPRAHIDRTLDLHSQRYRI